MDKTSKTRSARASLQRLVDRYDPDVLELNGAAPAHIRLTVADEGAWDAVLFGFAMIHVAAAVCWLCFNGNRNLIASE